MRYNIFREFIKAFMYKLYIFSVCMPGRWKRSSSSLIMNNNCHIGSASAVNTNSRVTFSVILSLLALLQSPSVCQGDGNVAQNSPPARPNHYYIDRREYNVRPNHYHLDRREYNVPPNQYYTAHNPRHKEPPPQEKPPRQEAPQNGSSNRNNSYYSVRQEAPPNDLSNWLSTYNTSIENTDENRPFNSRDCLLPDQPDGGHYELRGCDEPCSKRPNDLVPEISILIYTCNDKYILSGNNISVCISQRWTPLPSCHKICSPLRSTSVDISCSHKGETVSCTKHVLPGTRATLACKLSYTLPLTNDPAYREITCLEDGLWDNRVFRCLPECGTSIAHGNILIVNGLDAKVGVFPWHVGIYAKQESDKYEQICGGTLISSNLVISAAHCFYDEVFNQFNDASNYAVGAGKYFRDWDARDEYAQKLLIESIRSGERYIGLRGNFVDDIALVKLQTPFQLTTLVRPVCMDWDNQYQREQLNVQQSGKVVGWGKDIAGKSTKNLHEIDMPFVPYHQCFSEVPTDFKGYLTLDKFCAGHLNGSSVCDGDSGGGICFEKNGVWYLRGVVSVSPVRNGGCDYNSYVGFTDVSNSRGWIRQAYANALREL